MLPVEYVSKPSKKHEITERNWHQGWIIWESVIFFITLIGNNIWDMKNLIA